MKQIVVDSARGSYRVLVGQDLLGRLDELVVELGVARPAAMVSNSVVGPLYGRQLAASLRLDPPLELPDGEVYKRWAQVESTCAWFLEQGLHRSQVVIGVGGGVVTDMVGFAAAVFLRGIDWLAIPTTLLAMVDASVGGKTGVNLDQGKNLVGSFWPPRLVVADVATLATLPARELRAGLAELVKTAWLGDQSALELLDQRVDQYQALSPAQWQELVFRGISVKAQVVQEDEHERGRRQALNLGHTVGHALEAATGYRRFLHGEAVAWGLLAEAALARECRALSEHGEGRLRAAVESLGELPPVNDIGIDLIMEYLAHDKKKDDLGIAWALPSDDGVVLGQRIEADQVRAVLVELISI
jgi:3-dehydroquinate synthase